MAAMTKVKRLFDLEIDEISLVDRPANQHGLVAIAKRDEEAMPDIFGADGQPVDEDSLEHGDVVYDTAGNEYVFVEEEEDGTSAELQSGHDYQDEDQLVGVGKSVWGAAKTGLRAGRAGRGISTAGEVSQDVMRATKGSKVAQFGAKAGRTSDRNLAIAGGGAGAAAAGGTGYALHKGLGASVTEALSKALSDGDRNEVVSKLAQEVEVTKAENESLREQIEALASAREDDEFLEIAKSYNLPVHPARLANILKSAAATMEDEDLAELDRLLTAQSDLYEELGVNGSNATSAVLDQVQAMALETVGKSDVSVEQATVALFEANPAAYDEYLVEKGL